MTYVDKAKMQISAKFVDAYYRFPRRKALDSELTNVITKYFTHLASGRPFESRGLLVTGESRSGKTREINAAIQDFNAEAQILPDGQPARIVQCTLSGMLSWKDLGIKVLEALEFPMNAQRTQGYIWGKVFEQARLGGVIGIHFDECQHMFTPTAKTTNDKVLDGFKSLAKDNR